MLEQLCHFFSKEFNVFATGNSSFNFSHYKEFDLVSEIKELIDGLILI